MVRSRGQALGEALRQLRAEGGSLSQEGVALAARLDRTYFGKIERGDKTPTLALATVWEIAEAFETRPSDLVARAKRLLDRA